MRTVRSAAFLAAASLAAASLSAAAPAGASDVAVSRWNTNLIVTAPSGVDDAAVRARLAVRVTVAFDSTPLPEACDLLAQLGGVPFVIDPVVRATATPITLNVRDMQLSDVLTWVRELTSVHTGYLGGAVYVSDKPVAGSTRTVIYDVSDLALQPPDFAGHQLAFNAGGGGGGGISTLFNGPGNATTNNKVKTADEILTELEEMIRKRTSAP